MITRHDYGESRINKETGKDNVHKSHKYRALKTTGLKQIFIVRYCDDFKILCPNYEVAQKIYIATKAWLKERLNLEVSEEKSHITNLKKKSTEFLGFMIKAEPKAKNYVARSHITKKAKEKIKLNVREQAKRLQLSPICGQANKYNPMALGWHNYYQYATAVNLDFKEIHFTAIKTLYNILKRNSKKRGYKSKAYMKYYGNYNIKTCYIGGIGLYPLAGIATRTACCFTQQKCNCTEHGREFIHDKVMVLSYILLLISLIKKMDYL